MDLRIGVYINLRSLNGRKREKTESENSILPPAKVAKFLTLYFA